MAEHVSSETGWRGSPEGWIEAAYNMLIHHGVDAVKIMPLANRLKLARTSFYWHFKDREELLSALQAIWIERTTRPLIAAAQEYAESQAEAILNVIGCFLDPDAFDESLEFAIRGWALRDPAMMAMVHAEDLLRLAALKQLLLKWGHDAQVAEVRARTIYLVQIGYIGMQMNETVATRMARIPHYVAIYSGGEFPEPREIARFHARHGYVAGGTA